MLGDVVARIVRSDGKEMTIGDSPWRIPNDGLENWACLSYDVSNVEIPSYDGSIITSKRVNSRDRSITARLEKQDPEERSKAISFFNPKYSFRCYLKYLGRERWCEGEQIGFKCSEGNIYQPAELSWTILCPNPYLMSVSNFGKDIADSVPRLGFPFMSFLPVSQGSAEGCNVGFVASKKLFDQIVVINNQGDVPTGLKARIVSYGNVNNPLISIGDKFVKVEVEMNSGDVLEIDNTVKPPTVKFNGQNAMHLVDKRSTILDMTLEIGETGVGYDADSGFQYLSVTIYYNEQYLGI